LLVFLLKTKFIIFYRDAGLSGATAIYATLGMGAMNVHFFKLKNCIKPLNMAKRFHCRFEFSGGYDCSFSNFG